MREIEELNPPRGEMIEYLKQAIGEGYQPEHEDAVSDLSVIDGLNDGDLNREFGKCWQWYNMGGGFHETFENGLSKSENDYRREHLYNMKLQCLHAALIQCGNFDKTNATSIAEAINTGFDAIK
ncbi:TPA: hypothetical protein JLJ42_001144 [Escherichia coli]|uniref:hypothetical protein n=1 Tax=Escherichia coli TaxID=562 RepID=UPI00163EC20C|nr:hypothetical protein [Escherichia coli]EJZ9501524.1 hypothetical protein [Escherichia coli]MCO4884221.1 hypothetical protein [Escherichia coli]HAW0524823.1 hypothetical protein [Escherichia coli]HCN8394610.1 hypothetical protein [Escherichia coli]HDW3617418.1 hypothetical protein [Escherichia coli]